MGKKKMVFIFFKYLVALIFIVGVTIMFLILIGWIDFAISKTFRFYNFLGRIGLPPFKNGIE